MRSLLHSCILLVFVCGQASATHIIGGELFYDHQSGNDYQVTLKLYRDCGPSNTNATGFDALATVGVFDSGGALVNSIDLTFPGANPILINNTNPCLIPPSVCVEEAIYTGLITLPPITGGYSLVYQRCCRNPTVQNILTPQSQGLTCISNIPDPSVATINSSPHFIDQPPVALCVNDAVSIYMTATDTDGDSLVYELCTPFHGGSTGAPMPVPPDPPPYTLVPLAAGFSVGNMMPSSPGMAIDLNNALLTVTPSQQGFYAVGVCVKEYRNGQLLGQTLRDLRFDVVQCQNNAVSAVQQQQSFCNGLTISPSNQSNNANSYFWDFGVPWLTDDTSNVASPTYTYPDTGTYVVTLIANPGWPCSDTATQTFEMFQALNAWFTPPPITCFSAQPIPLETLGAVTANTVVEWDLGASSANGPLFGSQVSAQFLQPGTHAVSMYAEENGCGTTFVDSITLHPDPIVAFTVDDEGCAPYAIVGQNNSSAWTPMSFAWDLGDGNIDSSFVPAHVYEEPGNYPVTLTGWTTGGCIDTLVVQAPGPIVVLPSPTAGFTVDPANVSILDPLIHIDDASAGATSWLYDVDDMRYVAQDFSHSLSDGGVFIITQVVHNDYGCSDTAYAEATVHDHLFFAPNAFTPNADGMNDSFIPVATRVKDYELRIYDRWGQVIFETEDQRQGWSGDGATPGVYQYRATVRDHGLRRSHYAGTVTLVR